MKNNKKITKKLFIATMLFLSANLNSAMHTVTNGNDAGAGSLREIVANANSGDTIIFASNVSTVTLKEQITIDKSLTINGGSGDKRVAIGRDTMTYGHGHGSYTIRTRIFNIPASNIEVNLNNLIIENGKTDYRSAGIDVFGGNSNKVKITNCIFRNNTGGVHAGGRAIMIAASEVVAVNCSFEKNQSIGVGSAVCIPWDGKFIAINCIFTQNMDTIMPYDRYAVSASDNSIFIARNCIFNENTGEGAVSVQNSSFISINNTFSENEAFYGAAIFVINNGKNSKVYLHHNTFDKNKADSSGGAIHFYGTNDLYSYNSIYTANSEKGVVSEAGQIRGTISGNGKNLIENGTTVTRDSVFGNNEYENGYIRPLAFARSATPLTKYDIEVPDGMDADDIITWLLTDQIGKDRIPDSNGFVTFGAVECDDVGIREDGSFDVLVLPNPTDRDFNIIFDNPETQKVLIDLIDLEGKSIFSIFDGVVSAGIQVYRVNENLASGVYFVKFVFGNKVMLRKVVVRK